MTEPHEYDRVYPQTLVGDSVAEIAVGRGDAAVKPVSQPLRSNASMSERKFASVDPDEFRAFLEHVADLGSSSPHSLKTWLEYAEAWQITRALRRNRGNRSATARSLGIGRRTLYAKMEKLGITAKWGL